jgi:succinyl-CoA synthetase alpha subunit
LEADPSTAVIVIVSKPPDREVVNRILPLIRNSLKPVVVDLIGGDMTEVAVANARVARTIYQAAKLTVELAGRDFGLQSVHWKTLSSEYERLQAGQRYVRGVFSGGTFAAESALILSGELQQVYTNTGLAQARPLRNPFISSGHSCVDMGDDLFTRGKPHPMLEPSLRRDRILQEARDPSTAALLLDLVLGYGVHPDPARELGAVIAQARDLAAREGRCLPVVASVCGTEEDPQQRSKQVAQLERAGALVFESNAEATDAAVAIVQRSPQKGRIYE